MAVIETLGVMAEIYRLSREGGADSARFRRYTDLCRRLPVHPHNPMTVRPETSQSIEALLLLEAESIVDEVVSEIAGPVPYDFSVAVLTPGAWTHRRLTDVEYRVKPPPVVWFWAGESVDRSRVLDIARVAVARYAKARSGEEVIDLRSLAAREGGALRRAEIEPEEVDTRAARDAIEVAGTTYDMGSFIAWIHGDAAAAEAGYPGLGVDAGAGLRWSWESHLE